MDVCDLGFQVKTTFQMLRTVVTTTAGRSQQYLGSINGLLPFTICETRDSKTLLLHTTLL